MRRGVDHWKARTLDFSRILYKPTVPRDVKRTFRFAQEHNLEEALDATTLIPLCRPALENGTPVTATLPINNGNRVVGTMLGSEVTRRSGAGGPARRHDPAPVPGLGGPELRRLHPARHHAAARGRRQRLRRQGPLGRAHRRRPAGRLDVRRRGERHHRQRGVLRRDVGRGVHPRRRGRAVLRPQQRRHRGRRVDRRPRLRVHDRRARWSCSARPAATSRPACRAASRSSSTRRATSRTRCNPELVGLGRVEADAEAARAAGARAAARLATESARARAAARRLGRLRCRSSCA